MINHIISECSKLAQKVYETRHDWVGKDIHWELCKKLKFDHSNKWYMHIPESVKENETQKFLWDFEIKMNHLISARRPDQVIIDKKKKTDRVVYFSVSIDHRVKMIGSGKRYKYLDFSRELKKTEEHESDGDTNCN